MFDQCWPTVHDVGPELIKHWVDVSCLLGVFAGFVPCCHRVIMCQLLIKYTHPCRHRIVFVYVHYLMKSVFFPGMEHACHFFGIHRALSGFNPAIWERGISSYLFPLATLYLLVTWTPLLPGAVPGAGCVCHVDPLSTNHDFNCLIFLLNIKTTPLKLKCVSV